MTYALSAWFFTRALALVYLIAFVSLATQARGLWGRAGVLPIEAYLDEVRAQTPPARYVQMPSVFWLGASDAVLVGATLLGAAAAVAAFVGVAPGWTLLVCYALYLSFATTGQEFLSFQWDTLLLEVGFLALFAVPWNVGWQPWLAVEPHALVRFGFYLVLFKLMFLSGVVKLMSGDPAWRDLSALSYHYWTQPLPNPLSPFFHALPGWFHRVSTAGTFVIELGLPFLIFWPRARVIAFVGFTALSLFIFVSGNYTFFNLLTIALAVWLVPDSWWSRLPLALEEGAAPLNPVAALVVGVLIVSSVFWCVRFVLPDAVTRVLMPILRYGQAFHVTSPYGLFATMTKTRPEIVIEGSRDGETWTEYEFRYKPGRVDRAPPVIAPLQPRLDWQMWFAALGSYRDNPWLMNLLARLFEGTPEVQGFFVENPFPNEPPRFLRARLYEYEFGDDSWWNRRLVGEYTPTYRRP